jgi:uncharacterized protein YbaP (TraB family)
MRRKIIVAFIGLFWMLASSALAAERGALFRVSAAGHTMHLFGTIHVGVPAFYPLESRITQAVAGASVLALEVDPVQPPEVLVRTMQQHGMVAPSSADSNPLDAESRARLARVLKAAGLDPAATVMFKPWLLATLLGLSEYTRLGYQSELAVDAYLARLARSHQVPLVELESLDTQLALFGRLSNAQQWRFLDESAKMIENGREQDEARALVDAWRTADRRALDAIAARADADTSLSGSFMRKVMLEERNGKMAVKLAAMLAREKNSVAAIGTMHLLGKGSVPALLRARGLKVERVY